MTIERAIIKNYRTLRSADVRFSDALNIIVGDNESGKSTLLEAVNLALRCQLNRRPAAYELHPYLFNNEVVAEYVKSHNDGKPQPPPEILIELFLSDTPEVAELKGSINSKMADAPGISLSIQLDEEHCAEQYNAYIADGKAVNSLPVEYYTVIWRGFNGTTLTSRSIPLKSALIDPAAISNTYAANKYVLEIVRDYLTKTQAVDLALSYRHMRDEFLKDERIKAINADLAGKQGDVSDKILSMAMDTTTRASWETGVLPHLDDVPLTLVGKGEQNAIKIKLAIASEEECSIFLMEEPENHLSHANLNKLISHLASKCEGTQLIITTHSSFVLNKLGVDSVLMFNGETAITLNDLPPSTKTYFKRLPGHDTLRKILATRSILVEGPSDELIVQKAYRQAHGCMPLDAGVEVISVSLAFKRFLDIARKLNLTVAMARDNDGNAAAKKALYEDYAGEAGIRICIDDDDTLRNLERQLIAVNGRDKLNRMLGTHYANDDELSSYMTNNKTDCALTLFECTEDLVIPDYIQDAVA